MVTGLNLPVNLAFVPDPKKGPNDPLLYVTELYGQVKVITNDWEAHTFADDLLNYGPDYRFPGTGESGVTGVCVEPESGDVFISMDYGEGKEMRSRVVRASSETGLKMDKMETIIDGIPSTRAAHQVQAITIGYDGKLYVNFGDGMIHPDAAQDDDDLRGKVLRMNLDGSIPDDNPQKNSLIFAKGFRNPFGARWRESDKSLYISDNGPASDDRIAKVEAGKNYGWPQSMRRNSIFWWEYTQAMGALDFMQGDQFPPEANDQLFLCLTGAARHAGRAIKGKKIVKIQLNEDSSGVKSYDEFAIYIGENLAMPVGLSFGPEGLYFTDLFGESNDPRKANGNIYRIRSKELRR